MLTTGPQPIQRQGRKIRGDTKRANERLGQAFIDEGVVVLPSGEEAAMDIKQTEVQCSALMLHARKRLRYPTCSNAFEEIDRYIGRGLSKS